MSDDLTEKLNAELEAAQLGSEKMFPIQRSNPIPWVEAERAYRQYAKLFGNEQSLERIAQRGGFGIEEFACLWWGHNPCTCTIKKHDWPFDTLTLQQQRITELEAALAEERARLAHGPTIVCLCGSTRFYREFMRANYEETMAGRIVLSVGFYMHSSQDAHGETWGCTPEQKKALDELHFRKIELADEVLILNVRGYIGESTGRELAHAKSLGKTIRFLEPVQASIDAARGAAPADGGAA